MLPYIAAKTVTDINDGFNVCAIPQEQISRVLSKSFFVLFLTFYRSSNVFVVHRVAMWLHFQRGGRMLELRLCLFVPLHIMLLEIEATKHQKTGGVVTFSLGTQLCRI